MGGRLYWVLLANSSMRVGARATLVGLGSSAVARDRSARDRAPRSFRLRIRGRTRGRAAIQELAAKEAAITPIAIMHSAWVKKQAKRRAATVFVCSSARWITV